MKMIIIDDEIGIANSIKNIFDWNEIGIGEVCVFDSGADALERICIGDIDILMTDIRMPEMDGLELSRRAKEITPDMKIIMCSGYDDFEYAKAAMRLGVMEYLLKPVTLEEVTYAVKRAADARRKEKVKNKIKNEYENSLDMYIQNTKNMISAKLIQKKATLKESELKKYFEIIGVPYIPETGCTVCVKIIGQTFVESWDLKDDFSLLCFAMDNVLNEILSGVGHSFYDGSGSTVIFMFGMADAAEYKELTEKCISALRETLGVEIAVGIGNISGCINTLYDSYCMALNSCRHGAFYKKSGICDVDKFDNYYQYPQELENKLLNKMSVANQNGDETVEKIINEYFDEVIKNGNIPVQDIEAICDNILIACAKKLQSMNSKEEECTVSEWLGKREELENIDDLKDNLLRHIKRAEELLDNWTKDKNKLLVENAKRYIEDNIDKDLSLEMVSRRFFFSSRYFAKLFKEHTGKTYSDYVNDIKMEFAKKLLFNTDFSIGEIARKTGYDDQGHFGRNFKKHTGMKPSEYRKRR